jgi:hypothetical protein
LVYSSLFSITLLTGRLCWKEMLNKWQKTFFFSRYQFVSCFISLDIILIVMCVRCSRAIYLNRGTDSCHIVWTCVLYKKRGSGRLLFLKSDWTKTVVNLNRGRFHVVIFLYLPLIVQVIFNLVKHSSCNYLVLIMNIEMSSVIWK